MARRVHISHTDLDGEGCLILYHALYPDVEMHRSSYGDMETLIPKIAGEMEEGDHLLITDLNLKESVFVQLIKAAERGVKIRILDHHPTTQQLIEEYPVYVDDEYLRVMYAPDKCGTLMLYDYVAPKGPFFVEDGRPLITEYEDFAHLVNDYDLWLHRDPRSKQHNDLYFIYGAERFHQRFLKSPLVDFNNTERTLLELNQEQKTRYLEEKLKQAAVWQSGVHTVAVVYATNYISELGHHLLERLGVDFAIMLDPGKGKGSIRARVGANAKVFAERFRFNGVHGGGQVLAAGFPLDPDLVGRWTHFLITPPEAVLC